MFEATKLKPPSPSLAPVPHRPCMTPRSQAWPFCNWSRPTEERLTDFITRLELAEKIQLLDNYAPPVRRLDLPGYLWWSEALHGAVANCGTRCPTSFPIPTALGATFDMPLVRRVAAAIATEVRALHAEGVRTASYAQGPLGLNVWSPTLNLQRDPRWGRNQESPGEDPYHVSQYAIQFVRGLQQGSDPRYTKVIATCKHFLAYSVEDTPPDRHHFDAEVSIQDLMDSYLPAFHACVVTGGARAVMCAYNRVNGVPACAHDGLLNGLLRHKWNWEGAVISDCGAVEQVARTHRHAATEQEAAALTLLAGTDLSCGLSAVEKQATAYSRHLGAALADGTAGVSETHVNAAARRLYRGLFEVGWFDPIDRQPYMQYPPTAVDSQENQALALEAACKSIVLLENHHRTLPFAKGKRTAVIGPHATSQMQMLGNYHGQRCHDGDGDAPGHRWDCIQSPLQAITEADPEGTVLYASGKNVDEALTLAQKADQVVLLLGLDQYMEREGRDRRSLNLPQAQQALAKAIVALNLRTAVVLLNGGSLSIVGLSHAPAILEAWYGGQAGGAAIAQALFGQCNPGGKLPVTVYAIDFILRAPLHDMNMTDERGPGRTYRYYSGHAMWQFGHGLSYSDFKLKVLKPTANISSADPGLPVSLSAEVSNVGGPTGDEVVMVFWRPEAVPGAKEAGVYWPRKQLMAFQRVTIAPNASANVTFRLALRELAVTDSLGTKRVWPGAYSLLVCRGNVVEAVIGVTIAHPLVVMLNVLAA